METTVVKIENFDLTHIGENGGTAVIEFGCNDFRDILLLVPNDSVQNNKPVPRKRAQHTRLGPRPTAHAANHPQLPYEPGPVVPAREGWVVSPDANGSYAQQVLCWIYQDYPIGWPLRFRVNPNYVLFGGLHRAVFIGGELKVFGAFSRKKWIDTLRAAGVPVVRPELTELVLNLKSLSHDLDRLVGESHWFEVKWMKDKIKDIQSDPDHLSHSRQRPWSTTDFAVPGEVGQWIGLVDVFPENVRTLLDESHPMRAQAFHFQGGCNRPPVIDANEQITPWGNLWAGAQETKWTRTKPSGECMATLERLAVYERYFVTHNLPVRKGDILINVLFEAYLPFQNVHQICTVPPFAITTPIGDRSLRGKQGVVIDGNQLRTTHAGKRRKRTRPTKAKKMDEEEDPSSSQPTKRVRKSKELLDEVDSNPMLVFTLGASELAELLRLQS